MATPAELEQKFWKALKSDMTLMLGVDGLEDGHTRPMTAQLEHEARGPIWFFTATDNALVRQLATPRRAVAAFAAKGHALFASIGGVLQVDTDRAVVERLWNPFVGPGTRARTIRSWRCCGWTRTRARCGSTRTTCWPG